MSLPEELLRSRLQNEIAACRRSLKVQLDISDEGLANFPINLDVTLLQVPGPVMEGSKIVYRYNHRFRMIISKEYPFEKPLIIWQTQIFHPNIMGPEDGGHLCTRLLSDWNFNSNLLSFIKGIESLLIEPNGTSPFGTDSCTRAAQYFNAQGNKVAPVAKVVKPKVHR
ncbi:MAG: Ubiquitin-conjugating enzyme [Methanomassiliicoccales archaeon PtaU1.Bin124]|nr:MAG: Ubiquitin-conjugating enzyme [Methanomassiliicoccales archaeon PtaU1.Bin124]